MTNGRDCSLNPQTRCTCMTEPDPLDPQGPERVLVHSSLCPDNPDYDGPGTDTGASS